MKIKILALFGIILSLFLYSALLGNNIIDHNCTDLSKIPDEWITKAKTDLHIAYQHTSHGSQLITGMNALKAFPLFGDKYMWTDNGSSGLDLDDYGIPGAKPDLSQGDYIDENDVTPWVTSTRNLLDIVDNYHVNVIVWSWCSINGHDIQRYLDNMEILISEYSVGGSASRAEDHPVHFIFMTGHAEGQGEDGFIYGANQQIRQHCIDHSRILFDFADIESYDPDNIYYYDKPMWDNLDYNSGRTNNWGLEWCNDNPDTELEQLTTGVNVDDYDGCQGCAHSSSPQQANINCVLKGKAAWWMWARLSGWSGSVNGPQIISNLPDLYFSEDDSLIYPISNWYSYVEDPDDPDSMLTYTIINTCENIFVEKTNNYYKFHAADNWSGSGALLLTVSDGENSNSANFTVHVSPINDAPVIRDIPVNIQFDDTTSYQLNMFEYMFDVDTPDSLLKWRFVLDHDSIFMDYDSLSGTLELSALNYGGEGSLLCILIDNYFAPDSEFIKINVNKVTGITHNKSASIPVNFVLSQNFPNPFNPSTQINFDIPGDHLQAENVRIIIYDVLGCKIKVILEGKLAAGRYTVAWDGTNLDGLAVPSGVYIYRLQTSSITINKKMMLLR